MSRLSLPDTKRFLAEIGGRRSFRDESAYVLDASRITAGFHRRQAELAADQSKRKCALWGRRAGKSEGMSGLLYEAGAKHPGSLSAYIALTRKSAKRILWGPLKRLNHRQKLGMIFNETELVATLSNGSQAFIVGANRKEDIERLVGSGYARLVFDEAAYYPEWFEEVYYDALEPTLMDYDGDAIFVGAPAPSCRGFYHDITQPPPGTHRNAPRYESTVGWSVHYATTLDNPHVPKVKTKEIPDALAWIRKRILEPRKITIDHPYIQREYFARWVKGEESLVYAFQPRRNTYTALPRGDHDWIFGLAVDLGYDDPTAFVLFQWARTCPDLFIPRAWKRDKMIPATIAAEIRRTRDQVGGLSYISVDQGGGAGKIVTAEFEQRYGLVCTPAEKKKKPTFIEFMNGDFSTGRIKAHETDAHELIEEWRSIQWDQDPRRRGREDERYPNDLADAALYGYREARHYFFGIDDADIPRPEQDLPDRGSERSGREQERKMLDDDEEQERMRSRKDWF